jgi:protein-L-isoaspartate(D-aspartate) O-methyltransferase
VLDVMARVPRHLFVPPGSRAAAYDDHPIPIGHGQTISQPYIVAFMTEALDLRGGERVLEIGTGSGYQTAILARTAREVCSIEILETLSRRAAEVLARLNHGNVRLRTGNGHAGWPEAAPFDGVIVTCAPAVVPARLTEQLREGGRLVIPVGDSPDRQDLVRITRDRAGLREERLIAVRFVPMTEGPPPGAR